MISQLRGLSIACAAWITLSAAALAQVRDPYAATQPTGREMYPRAVFSSPTVSPYVNLGTTGSGVSNYQTIVRPMLEERELLRAQSEALQMARHASRDSRHRNALRSVRAEEPGAPPASVRFMHYSHYFRGIR
jgi:hypothetical protein